MKTILWILLVVYLLGIVAILTIDAIDNRKDGKLRWFHGHEAKEYWRRLILTCLGSWISIAIAVKNRL